MKPADTYGMKLLNRVFNLAIVLIIFGYGAFYFYSGSHKKDKALGQVELSSSDIEQVVNKYLKQTTNAVQMSRFNSDRALQAARNQPLNLTNRSKETNPANVPVEKQIWKDSDFSASPAETIAADVFDENALALQDEQMRKQYAQDFIDNARRGGFHVVLSKDLTKILSVTPIRKPSGEDDSTESFPSN